MLKNLDLFTNIVTSYNIHSFVETDITNWNNQNNYLSDSVFRIRRSKNMTFYLKELKNIYFITETLRNINEYIAYNFYNSFYIMLTAGIDKIENKVERDEINSFIKKIDFTEIFFNIGKLQGNIGNTNTALYYISLADKEYSEKQNLENGVFLKHILQHKSLNLWNIIPNINSEFQRFKYANKFINPFEEIFQFYGSSHIQETFNSLINDINTESLFQFIKTLKDYSDFTINAKPMESNTHYKSIQQFKTIENLICVFENYLKDKMNCIWNKNVSNKTSDEIIPEFLNTCGSEYSKYYFNRFTKLQTDYPDKFNLNTKGLIELLDEINILTENDINSSFAHLLLILVIYKNYSSNYLDNSLKIGNSDLLKSKLYLSTITCFLVAYDIFKN